MKHLQRRGRVSALIVISILMGCALSFTGCVTPVHQQKAAESFAKGYMALADFTQYEEQKAFEGLVALNATSVALQPGESLNDMEISKLLGSYRARRLGLSEKFRIFATIPQSVLEDDRVELLKKYNKISELDKQMEPHMVPFMGPRARSLLPDMTPAREAFFRAKSKEDIIKSLASTLPTFMNPGFKDMESRLAEVIKLTDTIALEVRSKAANIIENAEQPLLARLAALDKYNVASEVPYQGEALIERLEAVFGGATIVNNEMAKALLDPKYKLEDLQAFIAKVEEVIARIEKARAIINRISVLLVLL